jgi:hypothetical protein
MIKSGAKENPVLTGHIGKNNAHIFAEIHRLYLAECSKILDMTWGKGAFWQEVDPPLVRNDLKTTGNLVSDFTRLPFGDESFEAVIQDPPYLYSPSKTLKQTIESNYANNIQAAKTNNAILEIYYKGMVEAKRVLQKDGLLIVKCMDVIESGKQKWNHVSILNFGNKLDLTGIDLFVFIYQHKPTIRHDHQISARKNHSYFLVFRK